MAAPHPRSSTSSVQVGSAEHAEARVRDALDRGERLMGFGHRVYRAYDPRAAALRTVAEGMEHRPDWLELAIEVEDVVLRVLGEKYPDRPLKTNVEFYAAPVLMGVGLAPDLFPATFSLSRHAGWTAHALEQGADNRLIRPDVNYVGPSGARPPQLTRRLSLRPAVPPPASPPASDPVDDVTGVAAGAGDQHRRERRTGTGRRRNTARGGVDDAAPLRPAVGRRRPGTLTHP